MDFGRGSTKNEQTETWDGGFCGTGSLVSHTSYPYNFGVVVPGFFVPFPSYTMYPNAAVKQLVPTGFSGGRSSGVCEDWTGHQCVSPVSSQIQGLQLSPNFEHDFDPAPRYSHAAPAQQDWPHDTALHYANSNELDLPSAGIVVQASSDAYSHYNTTEQRGWYNQSAAHGNMSTGFDLVSQDNDTLSPVMSGFVQHASTDLFQSNGTSEETHFSGNGTDGTFKTSNTETTLSFNTSSQPSTSTYNTSSPYHVLSKHTIVPSSNPQTSFSSASTSTSTPPTSPTPSSTNASSPTPTRHPCPHCPSTFARLGDLKRHTKSHFPEHHRRYHCWEPGCDRNGRKAFTRRDKWRDHVRGVHGLEED